MDSGSKFFIENGTGYNPDSQHVAHDERICVVTWGRGTSLTKDGHQFDKSHVGPLWILQRKY